MPLTTESIRLCIVSSQRKKRRASAKKVVPTRARHVVRCSLPCSLTKPDIQFAFGAWLHALILTGVRILDRDLVRCFFAGNGSHLPNLPRIVAVSLHQTSRDIKSDMEDGPSLALHAPRNPWYSRSFCLFCVFSQGTAVAQNRTSVTLRSSAGFSGKETGERPLDKSRHRRTSAGTKGQWTANLHRCDADPRRKRTVDQTFAKSPRQL